jgi:hypothetical protein
MDLYVLIILLLITIIATVGMYLTITSVAKTFFEKQKWDTRNKSLEITLPLRLQAYERMCLFLERITLSNLLIRIVPLTSTAQELQQILLHEIREEYNHNLAQQIYIGTESWDKINMAMNEITSIVNQAALAASTPTMSAAEFAKILMAQVIEQDKQPTAYALRILKEEIQTLF